MAAASACPSASRPGEQGDPLLGVSELGVADLQQTDAAFVLGQALFERGRAVLQVAEDLLQFGQCGLKRWDIGHGVSFGAAELLRPGS